MKILALILARGGSKRLPGKNIRELCGKPLILWSIELAKELAEISDILVSTDSQAIADVAGAAGALVPWLRPEHLSTDTATSFDAAVHALDWYESEIGPVDGLLLLQPTSPFRSRASLEEALLLFESQPERPIVSMSRTHSHPAWCFLQSGDELKPALGWAALQQTERAPAFTLNGAIYLIGPQKFRESRAFVTEDLTPLIMNDAIESLDIDTEIDWLIAEEVVRRVV